MGVGEEEPIKKKNKKKKKKLRLIYNLRQVVLTG